MVWMDGVVARSAIIWSVGRLVGRSGGGGVVMEVDTTCLNAALLVARLTFFHVSVVCVCPLLLLFLAMRKDRVWTLSSGLNYIPTFLERERAVLRVVIKEKRYLQIEYHSLLLQGVGCADACGDGYW